MSEYLIQDSTLSNIADAIRAKGGYSEAFTPAQMISAINGIETSAALSDITILSNGVYNPGTGYDGFGQVTVSVDASVSLSDITISDNGIYNPAAGYDGFGQVTVNVQGGSAVDGVPWGVIDNTISSINDLNGEVAFIPEGKFMLDQNLVSVTFASASYIGSSAFYACAYLHQAATDSLSPSAQKLTGTAM